MSKIILGWQLKREVPDAHVHATMAAITDRYQPLFHDPIRHAGLWRENQGLLHFDVPADADSALQLRDDRIICLTGRPSITGEGSAFSHTRVGAAFLYEQLFRPPDRIDQSLIRQINPPFTLCWFDKKSQLLGLVHDGLGEDQFFIVETSEGIAFSNKCWPILRFLGMAPRIDRAAWKYWFCMGWFPESSTPFDGVRCVDRGEVVIANSRTVSRAAADTFSSWIGPAEDGDGAAQMTAAASSMHQIIRLNEPRDTPYSADLTGGLDSRAICSLLLHDGTPCKYFTGGTSFSLDVMLAKRIAKHFRLEWYHVEEPHSRRREELSYALHSQIERMLLWGEGLVEPTRFRHFSVERAPTITGAYLGGGSSEISKGYYYGRLPPENGAETFSFDGFLAPFERVSRWLLPDNDAYSLTHLLREQVSKGKTYGLEGLALLDYFYLSERTRRWQSAHLAINLFDVDVLPFINIDHIRLAFAMRPRDKAEHRFQRFIIAQNAAELLRMPFAADPSSRVWRLLLRLMPKINWSGRALNTVDWADYLRGAGRTHIERMLSSDSPLWQVLDRNKSKRTWREFLRGQTEVVHFPLGLLSFWSWHDMYIEPSRRAPQGLVDC